MERKCGEQRPYFRKIFEEAKGSCRYSRELKSPTKRPPHAIRTRFTIKQACSTSDLSRRGYQESVRVMLNGYKRAAIASLQLVRCDTTHHTTPR
ncbi:hypothetical protein KGM_212174 [Danaus plexippus plexippus]|uniref:Uncharacterized protein n=1 Tax=Danaus plexippus plexippus TaxID=278856 RepID=A0A212F0N1_DANPL|nr:hypothetical protein KGM_212174 [Danaus plexippus plexippus]